MRKLSDFSVSQTFKNNANISKSWNSHNIISRTEQSIKFDENPTNTKQNITCSKPISDFLIIKNLENFQFPHPQLLISFLSMHHPSSQSKIKEILMPYLLIPNFSINNAINAIADSLSLDSSSLIQHFTSSLDCSKAKEEWEKRFNGIPIDTNLKITEKWSLNTLDDLESLHLLACSINCKIYLMFNLVSLTNSDENTLFSTVVGPTDDSSFCIFFLCESPSNLIYAKPMFFSKQFFPCHQNFSSLRRLTLPTKKYAFYLNFQQLLKEIASNGTLYNSISTNFIVDPTISEPILSFSNSEPLKIVIRHPNDNYSYNELLEKLEHITASFSTTEPAIMDDHFAFNFKCDKNKTIKVHSNSLITVHSIKEKQIQLKDLHEITRVSDIEKLAWIFHSINFPPLTKSCDMKLFELIRFIFPFITNYKMYQTKSIGACPIITTHTDDFSLSEASKHPYSNFLCLYSIFNASTKSRTIACQKCHRNRVEEERKELVMIPVRTVSNNSLSSPFISWVCIDCFKRLSNREKSTIKGQFPMFHEVVDIDGASRIQSPHNMMLALQSAADRIHMSIMSIRSQPIGSLRAVVPRVDEAFNELIGIMKMFRQRSVRLKNVTAEDLATVRNSDEYCARVGASKRAVNVAEPDLEVVDYKMFELYLNGFNEKDAGKTEYILTQPESDIKEEIFEEAVQKMQELCASISARIESVEIKYPHKKESDTNDTSTSSINNNESDANSENVNNKSTSSNNNNESDSKNENNSNNENDSNNGNASESISDENSISNMVLKFGLNIKCENDSVCCAPILTNVYDVHLVESGNFITSMPLLTIKTRKHLKGISFHKENSLSVVVCDEKTATTELYFIPLSNFDLDVLGSQIDLEIDHVNRPPRPHSSQLVISNLGDCEVAFSSDCSSIAVLGVGSDENPLYIVTYDDDDMKWRAENAGSFPATKIAWLSGDESVLYTANDEVFCVLRFGSNDEDEEEETPVIDMPKHEGRLVKLIPSSSMVWALFDSGDCVLLSAAETAKGSEEEEEENQEQPKEEENQEQLKEEENQGQPKEEENEDKRKGEKVEPDSIVDSNDSSDDDVVRIKFASSSENEDVRFVDGFLTSEDGEIGVTAIDESGKAIFKPSPAAASYCPPSIALQPPMSRCSYNFPSGVFGIPEKPSSGFSSSQIALSFVELFPVLSGYFYKSSFFLVQSGKHSLKSYRPQNKNSFLIHSIRSFYLNEMMHVSLHHIEDTFSIAKNLKAKVVTFIDFGLQNCSSFIDSIFGTSFTFCEMDGVWIGTRTVNGLVYFIVFVKSLLNEKKCQVLRDASIASFLCLNGNQRNIFFLTENEAALFETLTSINNCCVLSSADHRACALLFSRNSKQKLFEFKTIESSLNNCIQNATIESIQFELYDDYSEIVINPSDGAGIEQSSEYFESFRIEWNRLFNDIRPSDVDRVIDNIKKMISLMSTLYEFRDIEPLSVIKNCFL